jgi:GMP synthase PP-ATPase subunit
MRATLVLSFLPLLWSYYSEYKQRLILSKLRAVQTTDFMTAEPYPFEFEFLTEVSRAIVNQVSGVSLVVYNTTSKPPVSL